MQHSAQIAQNVFFFSRYIVSYLGQFNSAYRACTAYAGHAIFESGGVCEAGVSFRGNSHTIKSSAALFSIVLEFSIL